MLTDPKLRSQVDQLWDKLWTGGLSNPFDAIEQLSYLISLKRLDDAENRVDKQAKRRGQPCQSRAPMEMQGVYLYSGKTLLHTLRGDLVEEMEKQMKADHNDD